MTPNEPDETRPSREPKERALAKVRDALAALEGVPGVALDDSKFVQLQSAADDVASLERALTNEVEQLREEPDDEIRTDGGREQCIVCAHPYDRDEHDRCPACGNSTLDEFATDGGRDR